MDFSYQFQMSDSDASSNTLSDDNESLNGWSSNGSIYTDLDTSSDDNDSAIDDEELTMDISGDNVVVGDAFVTDANTTNENRSFGNPSTISTSCTADNLNFCSLNDNTFISNDNTRDQRGTQSTQLNNSICAEWHSLFGQMTSSSNHAFDVGSVSSTDLSSCLRAFPLNVVGSNSNVSSPYPMMKFLNVSNPSKSLIPTEPLNDHSKGFEQLLNELKHFAQVKCLTSANSSDL